MIKIINFLIKNKKKGIYNISSNQCISKYKLGIQISKTLNLKNKILKTEFSKNFFVNRPKNMCISNQKLLRQFPFLKKHLGLKVQLNNLKKDFSKLNYIS